MFHFQNRLGRHSQFKYNIAISLIFRIRKFPVLSWYLGKIPCVLTIVLAHSQCFPRQDFCWTISLFSLCSGDPEEHRTYFSEALDLLILLRVAGRWCGSRLYRGRHLTLLLSKRKNFLINSIKSIVQNHLIAEICEQHNLHLFLNFNLIMYLITILLFD